MYVVIAYRSNGCHEVNYCGHWETEASWDSKCELLRASDESELVEVIAPWLFECPYAEHSFLIIDRMKGSDRFYDCDLPTPLEDVRGVIFLGQPDESDQDLMQRNQKLWSAIRFRVQELTELRDKLEAIKKKAAEEAEEKKRAENREARDRAEYLRLKLKYEGNEGERGNEVQPQK